MAFLTKSEMQQRGRREGQQLNKSASILLAEASAFSPTKTYDVFLSHSIRDHELILGVRARLIEEGLSVYVDWIEDKTIDRSRVTPRHADMLRKRMKACKTMIFVATDNSSESKWTRWEIGYFDGKGGPVSILPVVDAEKFAGEEFLGLYPVIENLPTTTGGLGLFRKEGAEWVHVKTVAERAA